MPSIDPVSVFKGIAVVACATAMITDMKWGKIYNWLTFPLMAIGFIANIFFFGLSGAWYSGLAWGLGILLYLFPAAFGIVGMGDVKLMAGIGALCGTKFLLSVFLYSCALGLPHAVLIQVLNYGRNAWGMFITSFTTGVFLKKNIANDNAQVKFHFYLGMDIFLGSLLAAVFEIPMGN